MLKLLLSLFLSFNAQEQCLADVMHAEARGESAEQRIAVAAVVFSRALDRHRNVCSITHQPYQFARRHNPQLIEAYTATLIYPFLPPHYKENYYFHSGNESNNHIYDHKIKGGNRFYGKSVSTQVPRPKRSTAFGGSRRSAWMGESRATRSH